MARALASRVLPSFESTESGVAVSSTNVSELVWLNVGVIGMANALLPRAEDAGLLGDRDTKAEAGSSGTGGGDFARAARAAAVPGRGRGVARLAAPPSDLRGVGPASPVVDGLEDDAFGVAYIELTERAGERLPARLGLTDPGRVSRDAARSLPVRPTYLLAREPGVILGASGVLNIPLLGAGR